jgi:hypothetical protein
MIPKKWIALAASVGVGAQAQNDTGICIVISSASCMRITGTVVQRSSNYNCWATLDSLL